MKEERLVFGAVGLMALLVGLSQLWHLYSQNRSALQFRRFKDLKGRRTSFWAECVNWAIWSGVGAWLLADALIGVSPI